MSDKKEKEWLESEAGPKKGEMMTNGEKNKKRFDELGLVGLPASEIARRIAVRKNGDVVLCELQTPCQDCIFKCGHCIKETEEWLASEAEPGKPKQERMVTRTVSYAKGEEVVYYNILYGFGRQDVLEKLYHYEQEEEEANERSIRGNRESYC
uniref:Uncharacterized protein n=1 Tax=Myoviridae sp. ctiBE32 TaxID=2826685 RepID=A0A8S5N8G0_9CAUD|nr:MAG TPA: hypothetical protein [Myoviridae sp. ctiBE32]